ncbi:hypothetical protein HBA54_09050 [Pelagibius litoralis]|uniref:Uncharacterized protein n=1 Tax=Pelagibius litoralis TaxID=374515 RepID=A0A967EVI9_9PROT|nr:hypothetical protein [Pelagibius litoralis]NIA68736.1 hypothetical protein [Pelagibius litoralis]
MVIPFVVICSVLSAVAGALVVRAGRRGLTASLLLVALSGLVLATLLLWWRQGNLWFL